ncbi:hypothetical protein [Evansella halocellulosilytica]|uniref:hypothetical protein n=1 Tax=Evansella halocellulosilytica TaxID=2011013 RepID=UPI000BB99B4A|nr:hypothetical protein [Evansella halocellulosilytica]
MQLYFSPEFFKQDAQVLNIVTDKNKPVGYLAFLMEEKKMYVYGVLQGIAATEDFKDLVTPYVKGLTKLNPELEVLSHLSVGGEKIDIEIEVE